MVSFYPGPSQLYPKVRQYMQDAFDSGILSMNHRSAAFVELSKQTVALLKEKLGIPSHYEIFFLSAATECWEIIGQSFVSLPSVHVYNGAFGEKWFSYRKKLGGSVRGIPYHYNRMLPTARLKIQEEEGVLCLTHCETSNGTQLSANTLKSLRKRLPKHIIAIDATSSMGGAALDWLSGDVWFASVQKCFGLPAGLALMICSSRAIEKAKALGHDAHYNSLMHLHKQMQNWQTTHTPNVLGIYLLNKVMEESAPIAKIHTRLKERHSYTLKTLRALGLKVLAANSRVLSTTVLAFNMKQEEMIDLKKNALKRGFLLGNGYGEWKESSFRIANFPAINYGDWENLLHFFKDYYAVVPCT